MTDNHECRELRESIKKIRDRIYGYNGTPGLLQELNQKPDKECLNSFVKKPPVPILIMVITIFVVPLFYNVISMFVSQQTSKYLYAGKDLVQSNTERIAVLEQIIADLSTNLADIRQNVERTRAEVSQISSRLHFQYGDYGNKSSKSMNIP